jgi:hypothetical protein
MPLAVTSPVRMILSSAGPIYSPGSVGLTLGT